MKPSGIEWIEGLPSHWGLSKISAVYSLRVSKVSDKDYPPLSVTKQGILPQLETVAKTDAHDDRKLVKKGDFVINSRSDRRGSCGISDYDGSVSLINTVLKPRDKMCPKYYDWLFHTAQFADEFYKWGHGIVDDLWTTNWQEMKRITIPVPPLETQQKIADYLDEKCGEIDKTIEKQKESIEKLKTYKQSLISETVTKGLNKSTPLKPSGITWLGDIPSHWEVKRVNYVANSFEKGNGITKDDVIFDGDIQCIRYGEIYSKYDRQCIESISNTNIDKIKSPVHISKGDILFAGTGELIEEIGKNIVYMGDKPCLAGGDIIILKHNQNPIFLNYALNSTSSQSQKSHGKLKLKVVHISASAIGNIRIALPPITEQNKIAEFLDRKCSEIDSTINKKQNLIEKLDAYKKSLIFECITGKRKNF